ncbi:hypothetical protein ZWY2020_029000 [Hordeum vulgare]|nr:hypothetical protein ZWY2020_029000 [Hordeum vulgare]
MLVRALWHFNEQTNPIPQRADLDVLVMAKAPNEGDFPLDQPPVGGLPDLREEIARSAPHEAILSELSSRVETIFEEVGTQVPLEEGQSLHDFTQTQVLWDGEGVRGQPRATWAISIRPPYASLLRRVLRTRYTAPIENVDTSGSLARVVLPLTRYLVHRDSGDALGNLRVKVFY